MTTDRRLTLMAVHAHPDDEASSTGGSLARYAAQGVETVLVTCTNGEFGDGSGGSKPGEEGHDEAAVVETRRAELERSCQILGVSHLELLGYHDSGMMGWPQNDLDEAFWHVPVETAAARLAELFSRHRPDVVLTYNENGGYGHPDHIQAHRVTLAALEQSGVEAKLYYPVIARSSIPGFGALLAEAGIDPPEILEEDLETFTVPDEAVTTWIDCAAWVGQKFEALKAHESQADSTFFMRLAPESFASFFSVEPYQRARDHTGAPVPESDLFAGLR